VNILKIRELLIGVQDSLADLQTAIEDAYSEPKIRAKVEDGLKAGQSMRRLSRDLGVPRSTLKRLVDNLPENESPDK
jgi:hypothetical protein